jgi:hypothetical protein
MVTLGEFLVELLVNVGELISIILFDVIASGPLSAISGIVGGLFIGAAVAVLGYLALGALGESISRAVGPLGRAPPQQD